jgi:hypothetical protein
MITILIQIFNFAKFQSLRKGYLECGILLRYFLPVFEFIYDFNLFGAFSNNINFLCAVL